MRFVPSTKEAYDLFHEGAIALSEISSNGMRVDLERLHETLELAANRIRKLERMLRQDEVYSVWQRRFVGRKINLDSRQQLADVIFKDLGYEVKYYTEKTKDLDEEDRRAKADLEAFEHIDLPFLTTYFKRDKFLTVRKKLNEIRREVVNGFLHPVFNLHTAITYRGCIAKGTLIEVVRDVSKYPKGIPIEKVKAGDLVYCYDDQCKLTIRKVLWAGKTGTKKVIRLHWSARGKKGYLDLTPEHKVRLASGEYVEARHLKKGRDFRIEGESHRNPKIRCLAMGRRGDLLYETGNKNAIYDHRLVYENLKRPLRKGEIIHHRDENHLNNAPTNLQATTKQKHPLIHDCLGLEVRRKGTIASIKSRHKNRYKWPSGEGHSRYIKLTKYQLLRMLANNGGKIKGIMDHGTIHKKAKLLGVNLKEVKSRYRNGLYLNREERLSIHNHKITKVEYINRKVDVYDLQIEGCHNFIANEICVHNSCELPNFQNIPVRVAEIAELIRSCFIPRPGHQIVETDFKGIEVCVAYCYHKDPTMRKYLLDKSKDMHRDMAAQCYMLEDAPPEYWKDKGGTGGDRVRYCGKNRFVFPQFYGSYFMDCAPALWKAIKQMSLTNHKGLDLRLHLKKNGIKELGAKESNYETGRIKTEKGTFMEHIRLVEEDFWQRRFKVYDKWKRSWYDKYLERGWFEMKTGFRVHGYYRRNQVINSPVQGAAFHCLMWVLIRLQKWLKKKKMKSVIVGQIHDSIVADVHNSEREAYLAKVKELVTESLAKAWDWIIIPMEFEAEVAPVGESWYKKEKVEV